MVDPLSSNWADLVPESFSKEEEVKDEPEIIIEEPLPALHIPESVRRRAKETLASTEKQQPSTEDEKQGAKLGRLRLRKVVSRKDSDSKHPLDTDLLSFLEEME